MSNERIPCPRCGAMILEVTAKYNYGLCARCGMDKSHEEFQAKCEHYRKNPPKSQEEIDRIAPRDHEYTHFALRLFLEGLLEKHSVIALAPSDFTTARFLEALEKIVREHPANEVAHKFLVLCDPIFRNGGPLIRGVTKLSRPYREAMAVYHLWGMLCSDGLESYLENADQDFDAEVELGLKLLERTASQGLIPQARQVYVPFEGLPDDLEKRFEDVLYRDLDEFEAKILGPFLISKVTGA